MVKRPELPGVHRVRAKGRYYYYAYRGGPRLPDPDADPVAFVDAYSAAKRSAGAPTSPCVKTVADLVRLYRTGDAFARLAKSTQRVYKQQLALIEDHFGTLALKALASDRLPARIREWRDSRANTPRAADYGVEVLSSLLQWGVRYGHVASNPARGIEAIHRSNRAHIVWTEDELQRLYAAATPECARALKVLAATGLRSGDVIKLTWGEIDFDAKLIDRGTNKSWGQTRAYPPLLDEARLALETAPRHHVIALTNAFKRPWAESGLGNAFRDARNAIGVPKTLHDLRGTAATRFALAGFSDEDIAGFMGWKLEKVRAILRRYVTGRAAALGAVERLRRKDK